MQEGRQVILFQEQFFDLQDHGSDNVVDPCYFARISRPSGNGGSSSDSGGASSAEVQALRQEINNLKNTINVQNTTINNLQQIINSQDITINNLSERVDNVEEAPSGGQHRELTQEEYNALSAEDKAADIEYFIYG